MTQAGYAAGDAYDATARVEESEQRQPTYDQLFEQARDHAEHTADVVGRLKDKLGRAHNEVTAAEDALQTARAEADQAQEDLEQTEADPDAALQRWITRHDQTEV